jgi:radical SAM protein with 4Fe4S-binding SPASM domain
MDGIKAASFLPDTAVLELTYRCNHGCFFCSCPWENPGGGFERRPELDTAAWQMIISELCRLGVSQIAFTGGEPLLREDLRAILAYAAGCRAIHSDTVDGALRQTEAPPKLYLLSNGRLVDRPLLEFCFRHQVQLSLSLPGLETYPKHTGVGQADEILACFSMAREIGLKTVANITVTRKNLDELEATISAALLAGAEQILLNRFMPGGRGLAHTGLTLGPEEVHRMLRVADATLTAAGRYGSTGAEIPRCLAESGEFRQLRVSHHCSAATGFFVMDPSGYIRVCNHSQTRLLHFHDWPQLKHDAYWLRFQNRRHLPASCCDCPQSAACDGGCREAAHIVNGAPDAADPIFRDEAPPKPGTR